MTPADLYLQVASCEKCRKGCDLIHSLKPEHFKYHWEPYWRGQIPLDFVFLAWEPSFAAVEAAEEYPQVGSFNEPLHFAIRTFLHCDRYLITNMAKCTIHTGPECDATRDFRYTQCAEFLSREMELASAGGNVPRVVTIGKNPFKFIQKHPGVYDGLLDHRAVHVITHYSPLCTPLFKRFAQERLAEFEAFCRSVGGEYRGWLAEAKRTNAEFGWHVDSFEAHPEQDLWRLFKWSHEMRAIRNKG